MERRGKAVWVVPVLLLLALPTLTFAVASVFGSSSPPSVSTDKTTYAQGDIIRYTGSGFTHGGAVMSWLAGSGITQPNATPNGNIAGTMQVGSNTPAGQQTFNVEDLTTLQYSNSIKLTITATPLFLSPSVGLAGTVTTITLGGSGYTTGTQYFYCFTPTKTACTTNSFIAVAPGIIPQGTTVQSSSVAGTYYVTVSSGGVILASATFDVQTYTLVHTGTYFDWYALQDQWNSEFANNPNLASIEAYPDQVYGQMKSVQGVDALAMVKAHAGNNLCPGQRLCLEVRQATGGGSAGNPLPDIGMGPGIAISFDAWTNLYYPSNVDPPDYWSTEFIPQETSNLFIGEVVASAIPPPSAANWPTKWWADDNSPFSYTMKLLVELNTGHSAAANWDLTCAGATYQDATAECADPLVQMFYGFHNSYPNAVSAMMNDIVNDGWINGWFPPPDGQLNSEYVAAYLSLGAGINLASQINTGFQNENAYFKNYPVHQILYTLDSNVVGRIWSYRNWLKIYGTQAQWALFYQGNYQVLQAVTTDKSAYEQGDIIQYTGSGFTFGGPTKSCLAGICVPQANANSLGYVTGTMQVGTNIPPGTQTFNVEDLTTGAYSNDVQLTISVRVLSVSTDKTAYEQGDTIHFTGSGFVHGGPVKSCLAGICVQQPNADSNGNVAGNMQVGTNIPAGTQTFNVEDLTILQYSNNVQLTISVRTLLVSTDRTAYAQGDTIHFTGSGFVPGGPIKSCLAGVCVSQPNADSSGNVAGTMLVGTNIPAGTQTYNVEDLTINQYSNNVPLTITKPTLSISPTSAPAGTTITLSGSGYTPGEVYYYCFTSSDVACTTYHFAASGTGTIPAGVTVTSSGSPGTYYVTTEIGGTLLASATYTLTPPLSVSVTPSSPVIDSGQSITLSANPSGGAVPYHYQWYSNAACTTSIAGATSSTYTASPLSTTTYCVKVTDSLNAVATASDAVTVNSQPVAGSITPANPTIYRGQSVTLTSHASGGTPPYTYTWYSGNSATCTSDTLVSGQTSATYSPSPTANTYYCYQVTDSAHTPESIRSATDLVSVIPPPTVSTDKTTYAQGDIIHFTGSGFIPGDSVKSCLAGLCVPQPNADGNGNVAGTMQVGTNVPAGQQIFNLEDLTVLQYSNSVSLTITKPTLSISPTSGPAGTTITLAGSGYSPGEVYNYCFSSSDVACSSFSFTATSTGTIPSGVTVVASGSPGTYYVTTAYGTVLLASATFTVTPPLSVSVTPASPSIDLGQSVTLTAHSSGGSVPYSYQWYSNAACTTSIAGATSSTYLASPPSTTTYCVKVTDSLNAVATATDTVTVNSVLVAGSITPSNPTISSGQSVTLTSHASGGTSPYTYAWYSGSSSNCASDTLVSGQTSSTYSPSPTVNTYYCYQVTDSAHTPVSVRSATDLVTVLTPPSVSTDKSTYAQGDIIHFTGSGFVPGGPLQSCLSTNNGGSLICVTQPNADSSGNVAGTMQVGFNIPTGPQKFYLEDLTVNTFSSPVQLTIILPVVTFYESGLASGTYWCVTFSSTNTCSYGSSIALSAGAGTYSYSVGIVSCGTGCQYVPSPSSGSITVSGSTSRTISFTQQYYLTMLMSGNGGCGSPCYTTPSSGWYNAGQSVTIQAYDSSYNCASYNWIFSSWTGSGSGSKSGTTNPVTITMNGPITETANYNKVRYC